MATSVDLGWSCIRCSNVANAIARALAALESNDVLAARELMKLVLRETAPNRRE
jgi:hypothetical protein